MFAAVSLRWQTRAAEFLPPTGSPPGGTIGTPINIGDSTQTKAGNLTLQRGITVSDTTANPCLVIGAPVVGCSNTTVTGPPGRWSWNGTEYDDWGDLVGTTQQFVSVFSAAAQSEAGYLWAQGAPAQSGGLNAALYALAPTPTAAIPSWGVQGLSHTNATPGAPTGTGIFAVATVSSATNYALYGSAPAASNNAWAGYFHGNVVVPSFDVLVGGSQPPDGGSFDGVSELCINDDCRSSWPPAPAADLYWTDLGAYQQQTNNAYSLTVGNTSLSTAPFAVTNIPSQSAASVSSNGALKVTNTFCIGNPCP